MRNGIVCDLNRCIGCLVCSVACKMEHNVPIGSFYNKVLRIGPNPRYEGAQFPDVEMYFLPLMCQHCSVPDCISACPSEAIHKTAGGAVLIDRAACDGCKLCIDACPYDVCYYNERQNVVEKCDMCNHLVVQGKDPTCVSQCAGRALAFGDLDDPDSAVSVMIAAAGKDVYSLSDKGNYPGFKYILRKAKWQG